MYGIGTASGERRYYGKVFSYEGWLEIQNGLKGHLTFTQIGEKPGRDRTIIIKEIKNYSVEQDMEVIRTIPVNTGVRWSQSINSANSSVTATVSS